MQTSILLVALQPSENVLMSFQYIYIEPSCDLLFGFFLVSFILFPTLLDGSSYCRPLSDFVHCLLSLCVTPDCPPLFPLIFLLLLRNLPFADLFTVTALF